MFDYKCFPMDSIEVLVMPDVRGTEQRMLREGILTIAWDAAKE